MADFYVDTLKKLLSQGVLRTDHQILVVCGADLDRRVLLDCGFKNVTISNVDRSDDSERYAPYKWSYQDAEDIAHDDNEFDFCIAHSGLHHCRSPHRALLEMYRVSSVGVIVFEPLDNAVTRMGVRLGLGQDYELAAVAGNDCECGGLRNSSIPNYVYRWTTRDVEKTILTFAPVGQHHFQYFYATRVNWLRKDMVKNPVVRGAYYLLGPCAKLFSWLFPHQCNNLAFAVLKPKMPADLHPWLQWRGDSVQLDSKWLRERYACQMINEQGAGKLNGQEAAKINGPGAVK
jgi:SAM-dependent methyltransferase